MTEIGQQLNENDEIATSIMRFIGQLSPRIQSCRFVVEFQDGTAQEFRYNIPVPPTPQLHIVK